MAQRRWFDDTRRRTGVLVHISSLPGDGGIGDLGPASRNFVEWLAQAGQHVWQILPLSEPACGSWSPYDGTSAQAIFPLLASIDDLVGDGLLPDEALRSMPTCAPGTVDFVAVDAWKRPLLDQAARALAGRNSGDSLREELETFCVRHEAWLAPYVAFTALARRHGTTGRSKWPVDDRTWDAARHRLPAPSELATDPDSIIQFLLYRQLHRLHAHARAHEVALLGDLPIYVSGDSAEVWRYPELFLLDNAALPAVNTGASPDILTPHGQVWAMPAFSWAAHQASGYDWWLRRLGHAAETYDIVRIDHYRAFADWWSVPVGELGSAGHWVPGPGAEVVEMLLTACSGCEYIAEDLGEETELLDALLDAVPVPKMRVLQQALTHGPFTSHHAPEHNGPLTAMFTGTHDFDTLRGWVDAHMGTPRLDTACDYLDCTPDDIVTCAIRRVLDSDAALAVVPIQDWLDLDTFSRMNVPGTTFGNWRWRLHDGMLTPQLAARLAESTIASRRSGTVLVG